MNHHRVPDFEMEEDYSIPVSTGPAASKSEMVVNHSIPPAGPCARKSIWPDEEIMELLWHNGQVVIQSQSQRRPTPPAAPPQQENQEPHLFIQEDEMVSWLQYPLAEDDSFGSDLLYTGSNSVQSAAAAANPPPIWAPPPRPPIHPPSRRSELQNFLHFSRFNDNSTISSRYVPPSSPAKKSGVVRETATVVESNNNNASGGRGLTASYGCSGATVASGGREAMTTCEMSLTSSTGRSSGGAELMSPTQKPPPCTAEDRKRKGREAEDTEYQSQDADFESANAKKQTPRGLGSTKRSRAAEVHNLSERRRRDRINEKMRALQELIPRCNKSDKASMLDEAIEYLKSLQLQIQMMSMGCGMVPMMFPGVQQYMPMGMGMGMGMNRPMMPFPNILLGSTMPSASAVPHMGPRCPIPPFQMQTMLPNDPNRVQAPNQSEHMSNSPRTPNQNQPQAQNFADPYQPYLTPQQLQLQMQMQMQMQLQQNQAMGQPSSSKTSPSMGPDN